MNYVLIISLSLILCIILAFGITYLIYRLTKRRIKKAIVILMTILGSFINFMIIGLCYFSIYYHADSSVKEYLKSSEEVVVTHINNGYYFDGKGSNNAIIFYPGAKVEYTSYAPLMYNLAKEGIDTFLIDMPFNMSFFGSNKADSIIKNYSYNNYYMMGHSLGGAVASIYASQNTDKIKGVILLASYSTKDIKGLEVLSIYGSNDGCLNKKAYEKNKTNLPSNYSETVIDGGNHADFGFYGNQKGDKKSTIGKDIQQKYTIEAIKLFFKL